MNPVTTVDAQTVRQWLFDGGEIALLDVREHGLYGDGHPLFAVSVPYSVFEARLLPLVPNRGVRMVLYDSDDGIAKLAAARANALGYRNVSIMAGGAAGWAAAGYTLFQGANVPSKTFGELLELAHHTPNLTAEQLVALTQANPNHVIVDSRPYPEYSRFNIPGGICCPNGEVALRIGALAPDPQTTIVINCAGRTRSILGAETLRAFGVPNPVYALQNGTQGWLLAGLQREEGASRSFTEPPVSSAALASAQANARACAERTGFAYIAASLAAEWLDDPNRTTYLFDVRSDDEFRADGIVGSRHALGGQLVQATDQYIGVRGCRAILMDDDMVRAPMMANWLHQLGYEVAVLDGGIDALRRHRLPPVPALQTPPPPTVDAEAAAQLPGASVLDLRSIGRFRRARIDAAQWAVRPLLGSMPIDTTQPILLVADDDDVAALAAQRLTELGADKIFSLGNDQGHWRAAGFAVSTHDVPLDPEFDRLMHYVHERNAPNSSAAAANAYLSWEIGLVDQLDDEERSAFRVARDHLAQPH